MRYQPYLDAQCVFNFEKVKFFLFFTEVQSVYSVLVSGVSITLQDVLVVHAHTHTHTPFQILFHYRLLRGADCSSLCCTAGPCC